MCLVIGHLLLMCGCVTPTAGIAPVQGFQVERFLGNWFEIARLDPDSTRSLDSISYTITRRFDGALRVLYRARDTRTGDWQRQQRRAWFVDGDSSGHLRIGTGGPFYEPWVIFELDTGSAPAQDDTPAPNYRMAAVGGYDKRSLRLLSRSPRVTDRALVTFAARARALGFDTSALHYISHGS